MHADSSSPKSTISLVRLERGLAGEGITPTADVLEPGRLSS